MNANDLNNSFYQIGIAKKRTDLTARQIRYYEEVGLIKPDRTESNYRIYSEQDIQRLKKIKELMESGMNTSGILRKLELSEQDND